jgi:hypothetical protein
MIELDLEPALVLRIPERETSYSPWSMLRVVLPAFLCGMHRDVENMYVNKYNCKV